MTRLFKRNNESNLRHLSNDCSFDLTRDARELLADTDPSVKWTFVSRKNAPDVMIGYGDGAENNNSPDDRNDAPLLYEASGQTVLCDAVDKALEKFEVKETEKLVGEYEVVSHEHRASEAGMGYSAADEDGFEIVEYVPA